MYHVKCNGRRMTVRTIGAAEGLAEHWAAKGRNTEVRVNGQLAWTTAKEGNRVRTMTRIDPCEGGLS